MTDEDARLQKMALENILQDMIADKLDNQPTRWEIQYQITEAVEAAFDAGFRLTDS